MKAPLQASITKVMTMQDQTVRLQVDCQEMHAEHMTELFSLKNSIGWFFFHPSPIKEIDTDALPEIKVEKGQKTKGQRLRAVLFIRWSQVKPSMTFEEYYNERMERFIENEKLQLDK